MLNETPVHVRRHDDLLPYWKLTHSPSLLTCFSLQYLSPRLTKLSIGRCRSSRGVDHYHIASRDSIRKVPTIFGGRPLRTWTSWFWQYICSAWLNVFSDWHYDLGAYVLWIYGLISSYSIFVCVYGYYYFYSFGRVSIIRSRKRHACSRAN